MMYIPAQGHLHVQGGTKTTIRANKGDKMGYRMDYMVRIAGTMSDGETMDLLLPWCMFAREAKEKALCWLNDRKLTAKTVVIMRNGHIVSAAGKNF